MIDDDLFACSALELVAGYGSGQFTPTAALASIHRRIDAVNPRINAVIAEDRDAAWAQAAASTERWAAGKPLSTLDGVPITIKDNIHVAGLPATWGSKLHNDGSQRFDEPAIERLRAAGLVFIGKTNVPEFTLQGYTGNAIFGVTRNPLALDRTPGGSTGGGAAAVAAGMGPIAIGTDGGGSLRRPAAHCGLFAFKPSIGQVARSGGFPQVLADFEVIGPIARDPDDLAAVFALLTGFDHRDARSLAALAPFAAFPPAPHVGYFADVGRASVDPKITAAATDFIQALRAGGCTVETIGAPFVADAVNAAWGAVAQGGMAWHIGLYPDAADKIGANAASMAARGNALSARDYIDALDRCATIRREAMALFENYDLLLSPTTAALAWTAEEAFPTSIDGQSVGPRGHAVFTAWANVSGLAATSLPVAVTDDAGGIGMQLIAAPGRDRALLDFISTHKAMRMHQPTLPIRIFP